MNAVAQSLDKDRPNSDEAEEYEYVYMVNKLANCPPTCLVEIEGQRINIMIDTGASVNTTVIDETTYGKIIRHGKRRLEKPERHIYSYGSSAPLPVLGTFVTTIELNTRCINSCQATCRERKFWEST